MSFMQLASCLTAEVQIGKWVVYVARATVTLCFWTNVKKGKSLVTRFLRTAGRLWVQRHNLGPPDPGRR